MRIRAMATATCLDCSAAGFRPIRHRFNTQQSNMVLGGLDERKWGDGAYTTIHQFQIASLKHIIIITAIK